MYKIKLLFPLIFGLMIYSCMSPTDPEGISSQLEATINTGGYCLNLDYNDSLLIAAADENGYQIYTYQISSDGLFTFAFQLGNTELSSGEYFRANNVLISKMRNYFLLMDKNDGLYASSNLSDNNILTHIYSGSSNQDYIQDVFLNENGNSITMYTLNKNNTFCSVYLHKFLEESFHFFEDENGILWFPPGPSSTDGFSVEASDIFLIDSLLIVANSQLGVKIIKVESNDTFSNYYSFDTPGIAETVHADSNIIFTGLGNNKGCIISPMDTTVLLMNQITIADGYSVKGIHKQNDLLALACGDDGVLLYTCHSDGNLPLVSEIGRINSEYAYNVKIYNSNTIFVATKEGIQIFTIDR